MDQIRLHRVDPILVPDPVERKVYKGRDRLVRRMIRILPAADPVVSAKLVGSTPITVGFDITSPTGRRKLFARMCLVYVSMKETGVMQNPLHVNKQKDGLYYLARGSQRYCALVALENIQDVPCRIVGPSFSDVRLLIRHPYTEIQGLYQNRREQMIYALYRCLYGEDFVQESIRSIVPYVDKIFIFWTDKAWGNATSAMYKGQRVDFPPDGKFDQVRDRLADLEAEFPGQVILQHDHVVNNRNQFTHLVNDRILPHHPKPDMLIMMEVDYVWRKDQIEAALKEFKALGVQNASSGQVELWKTFGYQAMRDDVTRKATMFWKLSNLAEMPPTNRHADAVGWVRLQAFVHNLGFCASANTIYWKHLTAIGYCQKIGDSPPNEAWYDDVWRTWDYQSNNRNLEMSRGYEALIPHALPYDDRLPEVLEGVTCPT